MIKGRRHSSRKTLISVENSDGQFRVRYEKLRSGATPQSLASRSFPGTDELLAWVSTDKSEGAARINRILELFAELSELKRASGDEEEHLLRWQGRVVKVNVKLQRGLPFGAVFLPPETEREEQIRLELVLKLERYKMRPYYWATIGDYPIVGWRSAEDWPVGEDPAEDVWLTEQDAILAIFDLHRAGLWRRVRRCQHCRDWFLAKFSHQKFCCLDCQQKFFRSSEDYKKMRRTYMKDRRAAEKKRYFASPEDRASKRRKGRQVGGKDSK